MTTGTWRVVVDDGGVREVPVRVEDGQMSVGAGPGPRVWDVRMSPRFAVASLAVSVGWRVREILAPGEATAAERVAAETARCAAVCRAQAFAGDGGIGRVVAEHCADAIERGPVTP